MFRKSGALDQRYGPRKLRVLSEDRQRFIDDLVASGVMRRIEAKHPSLLKWHERQALSDWQLLKAYRAHSR